MKHLDGVLRLVDKEFNEMEQNGKFRSKDDVELAYKLIDIAKDVYCIWEYENKMQDGYSEYGQYPNENYGYNNSYARNGSMMNRNSRGQFTSREGSYDGYSSRRRGYSRGDAREEFINQLRDLMEDAPDDRTREHVQRMIHDMEQ